MAAVGVLTVHHEEEGRRAVRAAVAGAPGFTHMGEAGSAEEALELALALRPALALIATGMPGIDGRETGERITAALPETVVVLLGDSDVETLSGAALHALWEQNGEE
jgi:DNA-binding NarL/FixJ family response regulator